MSNLEQVPFAEAEFAENPEPRCPCLLLLDTSGSMAGAPIAQLNLGIRSATDLTCQIMYSNMSVV